MTSRLNTSMKGLTISVVSHGHEVWLWPLLEQLAQAQHSSIERVILTHNVPPPPDWNRPDARNDWPFELLELTNPKPLGFSANHNRAFALQDSACFAVLNPDFTHLPRGVWAELVDQVTEGHTGFAYPQLLNPDGTLQDNQRPLVTPWSLVRRHLLGRETAHRDWVSGACMVFSSEVFKELGGFDEGYYLYCEDVDMCIRLQLAGWKMSGPHGSATHAAQRSSQESIKKLQVHLRSLLRLWTRPYFWRFWFRRSQFR